MMLHGQIETITPTGLPNAGTGWRVWLDNYQHISPYPATLKCYKRMGNPGNYWWMYSGQQVTLYAGGYTTSTTAWEQYGCPPVRNGGQQGGSPPQVKIDIAWGGFGTMANISKPPFAFAKKAKRR